MKFKKPTAITPLLWVYPFMEKISKVNVEDSSQKFYLRDEKMKWSKTSFKVSVLGVVPLRTFRKTSILTLQHIYI